MSRHDVMVWNKAVELFANNYHNVRAHLPCMTRPEPIPGMYGYDTFIPDVTGYAPDGTFHVFEVETDRDDLNSAHTQQQCLAFGAYSDRTPGVKAWLSYPPEFDAEGAALVNRVNAHLATLYPAPHPLPVYSQWDDYGNSDAPAYGSLARFF